jgi:hypothetical protein
MKRPTLFATVVAVGALLIAGCGGSDDETTDTTAPASSLSTLTKEDLLTQGDAICAEVNAAIGSVSSTEAEPASRVAQEADLYEGMVERLKGLGEPDDTTGYDEFIAAADRLAQAQSDAALAAARGDSAGLESAQSEASSALGSFQSAAQAYGFEECGEAPSAPVTPAGAGAPSEEAPGTGGVEEVEEEVAPEEVEEEEAAPEPETGGAGSTEAGGGAGGGTEESGDAPSSGGVGPG